MIIKKIIFCFILIGIVGVMSLPSYGASLNNFQDTEIVQSVKSDTTQTIIGSEKAGNEQVKVDQKTHTNKTTSKAYTNIILYLIYKISGKVIN